MISLIDQLGRNVSLPKNPTRIISLVPSQTELLFDLGLDEEIIGITRFCTHPAGKVKNKPKIGGTKQLNIDLIKSLTPDLIIANKEENERLQIEELARDYPVYISNPHNLPSALQMISDIGQLVGRPQQAEELIRNIIGKFERLQPLGSKISVAYLIWRNPYMVAGAGTFIDDMLKRCGFTNVITKDRYPEISPAELAAADPDLILLSSEPYPFAEKHIMEFNMIMPGAPVKLVDGEIFSWYGSRPLKAADYFISLTASLKQL